MWSPGWPGPCPIPTLSSHLAPTHPGPSKPLPLTFPSELEPSEASPPGTLPSGSGAEAVQALPDVWPECHTLQRHTLRVCLSSCRCVPWKKELQEGAGECLGPSLTPCLGWLPSRGYFQPGPWDRAELEGCHHVPNTWLQVCPAAFQTGRPLGPRGL